MRKLDGIKPERVFYYFEEISKIPRCSLNEDKIAQYLVDFAKDKGLDFAKDDYNNVIIKKDGTNNRESETIILQGHMDMVCEKTEDCSIDFQNDEIPIEVEGDFVLSRKTTLGADNGIAVAMSLAILEDENIEHPPLEVLITSDEESGMTGALNLDGSLLKGKTLINLDSEEEGVACVSCAGGQEDIVTFTKDREVIPEDYDCFTLSISGLNGGHSGMEIDKGLGNSNKLLGRALSEIREEIEFKLIDIYGGAKPNAIPRFAESIIAIKKDNLEKLNELVDTINETYKKELKKIDGNIELSIEESQNYSFSLSENLTNNLIDYICIAPNGIQTMSKDIEGLVESSTNMGVINSSEKEFKFIFSVRSSVESLKSEISLRNSIAAKVCGGIHEIMGKYPAWEYKEDSKIREIAKEVYLETTGNELKCEAIHAGLECGLFKERIGDLDMLSIGPNIYGVHAPGEKISIKSTENVYEFLLNLLKKL